MNVFVAFIDGWEEPFLVGVFSTLEIAQQNCDIYHDKEHSWILEYILDNKKHINQWFKNKKDKEWKKIQ